MKYIRTKEKIYENILNDILPNLEKIECQDIIKKADTIEELCDEFVVLYNNGRKNLFSANEMANKEQTTFEFVKAQYIRFCKEVSNYEKKVYGAIWTDKGLIFVAKMNDKGGLELI